MKRLRRSFCSFLQQILIEIEHSVAHMVVVADVVGAKDIQSFGGLCEGPREVGLRDFLFGVAQVAQARTAADHSVVQEELEEDQKSDPQVEGQVELPLEFGHYARKEVETHR